MTDPLNMPVIAMTRNGTEKTTLAKALNDLEDAQAIKRAARRCSECGKYQKHEALTSLADDDGTTHRVCSDCLDDSPALKAAHRREWSEALETIDLALAKASRWFPPSDALAKSQAIDRLVKSDSIGNFGRMVADYRRRWAIEDRVVSVVKAERTDRETARLRKQTKRIKKKTKTAQLRKAQAVQTLDNLMAEQAALAAQIDGLGARVAVVYRNAERAFGAVAKQREIQAIADLARRDQEQAGWAHKASLTTDPTLRAAYLARANGEELTDDD
jgi:hypothetical protein